MAELPVGYLDRGSCGFSLWRGEAGAFLVFTQIDDFGLLRVAPWNPSTLELGPLREVPISGYLGRTCASMVARDVVLDGNDEIVMAPYVAGGLVIVGGNPLDRFHVIDGTLFSGGAGWQQRKAAIEDINNDGLLDVLATHSSGEQVDVYVQKPADATGRVFDFRPDLIPLQPGISAATSAMRIHPDDPDAYVFVSICDDFRDGWSCIYRVTPSLEVISEPWRTGVGGPVPNPWYSALLSWDVDGDGYRDLVGTNVSSAIGLWRRPAYEDIDGLYGPRPLVEHPFDGGMIRLRYADGGRVLDATDGGN